MPAYFFVYFRPFLITISGIQNAKRVDDMHGIRTRGRKMVCTDDTTELWRIVSRALILVQKI